MLLRGNVSSYRSVDGTGRLLCCKKGQVCGPVEFQDCLRSQSLTLIQVLQKVGLVHMQHHHGVQGCIDLHGLHMPCLPAATWFDTAWMAKQSIQ